MTPPHLQGFGTYEYECRKKDCWHCAYFGLIPSPNIYIQPEKPFIPRTIKKKKRLLNPTVNKWTKEERQLIINNIWMNGKELKKLIPRHSLNSINRYIWQMRQDGTLEKHIKYVKYENHRSH